MHETENWVAIGFLFFLGLLVYLGAHRKLIDALDQRQARIKSELDEARRLRQEAQALLAEFERKGREAETEAAAIIAGAKAEAERLAAEAKARIGRFRRAPDQDGGSRRSPRPRLRRSPTCAPPRPKPQSPPPRRFLPPPPRARSRRICSRRASPTSNKNSIESSRGGSGAAGSTSWSC